MLEFIRIEAFAGSSLSRRARARVDFCSPDLAYCTLFAMAREAESGTSLSHHSRGVAFVGFVYAMGAIICVSSESQS